MRESASTRQKDPKYRLHKPTGQAFVELNGRRVYLGRYDLPETVERYHRTMAEWIADGRQIRSAPKAITIVELIASYWEHCKVYYVHPNGSPSSSLHNIHNALLPLKRAYGSTPAADFGPNALRAVRQQWIDSGLSRKTINGYTACVKALFKWGVAHELVPASVHQALSTLEGLRFGRSGAKETNPVEPVPMEHVDAVKPLVSRQVAAMIDLQLLTGARSGEVVILRPMDLDTSGPVWTAKPQHHKGVWRQKERIIYLGPKAQAIVKPFLLRTTESYLFSPKEAEAERHAEAEDHRRPNQKPSPRKTARTLLDRYDINSYRRAIARACGEAGISAWHPHQLRHTAATEVRKRFGLEAAQLILGHARADVTQVYAEINQQRALEVAAQIG